MQSDIERAKAIGREAAKCGEPKFALYSNAMFRLVHGADDADKKELIAAFYAGYEEITGGQHNADHSENQ